MRPIDADKLIAQLKEDAKHMDNAICQMMAYGAINDVKKQPTIDIAKPQIVRCGECIHAPKCYGDIVMVSKGGGEKYCPVEYCSMGERRTDDE